MSNEVIPVNEQAIDEPTKAINHEVPEAPATNGSMHSNGKNQVEEDQPQQQQQQQTEEMESLKPTYDDNDEQIYNKNELEPEVLRKVFIGGLSYKTDDQNFKDYFSNYGDVVDCIIMRDREGRSRGFGFVTYTSSAMVDRLMAARPHMLDSREIEPKRAVPREESGKPESSLSAKKLFVGGIREGTIDEHDLNEYFSKYGNIIDAVIMKTNEGKQRGFGFVEFDDYDPVDKIVLEKHHVVKGYPVNVEKALPKEQTNRARMAAANNVRSGGRGGMRGPPSRMAGGWEPMGNGSNYSGGGGGYRSSGGYGRNEDNDGRPAFYGGGYGGDMGGRNNGGGMMGYGGSSSMNQGGGGYGMDGPPQGGYDDPFGAFGPPPGYQFGQNYGSSSGGGPMRRGGINRGGNEGPYTRDGGGGYRGRAYDH